MGPDYLSRHASCYSRNNGWQGPGEVFSVMASALWNILPLEVRFAPILLTFHKHLKTWFCQLAWGLNGEMPCMLEMINRLIPDPTSPHAHLASTTPIMRCKMISDEYLWCCPTVLQSRIILWKKVNMKKCLQELDDTSIISSGNAIQGRREESLKGTILFMGATLGVRK